MKFLLIPFLAFFQFISLLTGQQLSPSVIASEGGTGHGAGFQLEYTLGELAVDGITGQQVSVTEGFHQPILLIEKMDDKPELTDLAKAVDPEPSISLSPNPVSAELTIKFNNPAPTVYTFQVRNANGILLLQQQVNTLDGNTQLDLTGLLPGIYYVHCTSADQSLRTTYKISKIQ